MLGSLGGGAFTIASGTIGPNDLGSGSVLSGAIASGQIGPNHLGSGVVTSGAIASGQVGQFHLASGAVTSGSIASGQVSQFKMASGAINSGVVGSGAVLGSLGGGAFTVASGTVGPNDLGSGSVLSGAIASGQIGPNHLGSGAVLSGAIASGQVGQFAVASGAITSGRLGVTGTPNGTQVLRDDFTWAAPGTPTITSGSIGSGAIASGAVEGFFGTTRQIASGSVGVFDFGSGAVVAGTVGSGAVASGNIASGSIGQFHNASGSINSGAVSSGAVLGSLGGGALTIASGTIGPNDYGSGSVRSGAIASGQIGTFHVSSGAIVTYGRNLIMDQYNTGEIVSGVRCVQFDPTASGQVRIAMAAVSGRAYAHGIAFTNALSGQPITIIRFGEVLGPSSEMGSGLCISGRMGGRSLWMGASGQVVTISGGGPGIGVGATNSGAWGQRIGSTTKSGAVLVDIVPNILLSGAATITTNPQTWPA